MVDMQDYELEKKKKIKSLACSSADFICNVCSEFYVVLSNYFGYYASIKTLLLITMMLSVEYRLIDICVMSEKCICKFLGSDDELDGDDTDACEKYPP